MTEQGGIYEAGCKAGTLVCKSHCHTKIISRQRCADSSKMVRDCGKYIRPKKKHLFSSIREWKSNANQMHLRLNLVISEKSNRKQGVFVIGFEYLL